MISIYALRAGPSGPIKIGATSDLIRRWRTLQTGAAFRLRLVTAIPADRELERRLHDSLAAHRLPGGEWFTASPEVLAELERLAATEGAIPFAATGKEISEMPSTSTRPPNPKIDPESPAARIAARFDRNGNPRASGLANAIGRTPSTVQRWLEKGAIPSDDHAEVVAAGRKIGVTLKPADFVDARAFAKAAPAEIAAA